MMQMVCSAVGVLRQTPDISAGLRLTLTLAPTLTSVLRSRSVGSIAQRCHHALEARGRSWLHVLLLTDLHFSVRAWLVTCCTTQRRASLRAHTLAMRRAHLGA